MGALDVMVICDYPRCGRTKQFFLEKGLFPCAAGFVCPFGTLRQPQRAKVFCFSFQKNNTSP
jgi:hypothetical protein